MAAVEVLTLRDLVTYYVLFFIHLESRRVEVAGIMPHPNDAWMKQIARNVTMDEWGFLGNRHYLIHDRDTKFTISFRMIIKSSEILLSTGRMSILTLRPISVYKLAQLCPFP